MGAATEERRLGSLLSQVRVTPASSQWGALVARGGQEPPRPQEPRPRSWGDRRALQLP